MKMHRFITLVAAFAVAISMAGALSASAAPSKDSPAQPAARFTQAAAFDVSRPLSEMAAQVTRRSAAASDIKEMPERGPTVADTGYTGDGALQTAKPAAGAQESPMIPGTLANFEGLSNQDNFNIYGGRVNPPDPVGDVGGGVGGGIAGRDEGGELRSAGGNRDRDPISARPREPPFCH